MCCDVFVACNLNYEQRGADLAQRLLFPLVPRGPEISLLARDALYKFMAIDEEVIFHFIWLPSGLTGGEMHMADLQMPAN